MKSLEVEANWSNSNMLFFSEIDLDLLDLVYGRNLKMTPVHVRIICHLSYSVCVAASVVPLWHKIMVIFRFFPYYIYLWKNKIFELDKFASMLFKC